MLVSKVRNVQFESLWLAIAAMMALALLLAFPSAAFAQNSPNPTGLTPAAPVAQKSSQKIKVPTTVYGVAPKASSFKIKAKAKTKLSFKSDNNRVAKVSKSGKVSVGRAGMATITITAAESATYKSATRKVKVRVTAYKKANGYVVHSGSNADGRRGDFWNREPKVASYFHMNWCFIIRPTDPYVSNHAATAVKYISRNKYFGYNSRYPTSQTSVTKRAEIYKAVHKAVGDNPSYADLKKIAKVRKFGDTSCTPVLLAGYWLYVDMDSKLTLKWRPPYSSGAYKYYCGAVNVENHQLEKAIRHVNKEYKRAGKPAPFKIIYVPGSKRGSFFSRSNISKNLKRGDIICACPNPRRNGHTAMVM